MTHTRSFTRSTHSHTHTWHSTHRVVHGSASALIPPFVCVCSRLPARTYSRVPTALCVCRAWDRHCLLLFVLLSPGHGRRADSLGQSKSLRHLASPRRPRELTNVFLPLPGKSQVGEAFWNSFSARRIIARLLLSRFIYSHSVSFRRCAMVPLSRYRLRLSVLKIYRIPTAIRSRLTGNAPPLISFAEHRRLKMKRSRSRAGYVYSRMPDYY